MFLHPLVSQAQANWCRCPGGEVFQPGLVNYKENSDREIITRIEVKDADPDRTCEAAWIAYTEVYANGTAYSFHLQRKHLKTIREEGCGDTPDRFVSRSKTYDFVLGADSQTVRELSPAPEVDHTHTDSAPGDKSNANLWESISTQDPPERTRRETPARNMSAPEFSRTAWVLARHDIKAHYVGLVRGVDQRESIIPLGKTETIRAGELGQIEASNGHTAIIRFYAGSRMEKFARKKNAFRRWYDSVGGPYTEAKDDLYTPVRACIVQVSLDDIVEVNDYLDERKTDKI
jgi:hypothetical protein